MKKFIKILLITIIASLGILSIIFFKRIQLTYGLIDKFISIKANASAVKEVNLNVSSTSMNCRDVLYKSTNDVQLHLDIYSPLKKKYSSSPVIMYVHGGCWAYGDKSIPDALNPILKSFREEGYTIIGVEYELMKNKENFNKQVCDIKDAIRWIHKNENVYNIDPNEIGIIGISSGAHISMLAAYSDNNSFIDDPSLKGYPSDVKYIIDLFGPTDLKLLKTNNLNYDLNNIFSSIKNVDKTAETYNPINYVNKNIPDTLIVHSKADNLVPYTSSTKLYEKCQQQNAKSELVLLKSSSHDLSGITDDDISEFSFKLFKFIVLNSPI